MSRLPQSAQEIANVIGREQALRLIGQLPRCGRRPWRRVLYVPARLTPDHWLVTAIGYPDAAKLVREFRGIILQPSTCAHLAREHRNRAIHAAAAQGATQAELAILFDLTTRQVANVLAETPPEDARGRRGAR